MRPTRFACTALIAAACGGSFAQDALIDEHGRVAVGRYTTVGAAPAQEVAQPLAAYVRVSFPRQTVATVGDAIRHTLLRTGWRMVNVGALDAQARQFLKLPLPDSQRTLGPYQAREVLAVLTGPAWVWHEDPMQRLVSFSAKPSAPAVTEAVQVTPPTVKPADPPAAALNVGQAPSVWVN